MLLIFLFRKLFVLLLLIREFSGFRLVGLFSLYHFILIGLASNEEGVLKLMNRIFVCFYLGEGVEVELAQKGSVVAVSEVLGEESTAKLVWFMDDECATTGRPADETLIFGGV